MKNTFAILLVALSISQVSRAEVLLCQIKENTKLAITRKVLVAPGAKVLFADVNGFRFTINSGGSGQFEIETFDPNVPARTYAQGRLQSLSDVLKSSLWTRYVLLETSCQLLTPNSPSGH
jgi:hypothetical protein